MARFARPIVFCLWLPLAAACGPAVDEELPAVTGLRVNTVLSGEQDARFLRADGPREFSFPADHGAHPLFRSEWWYVTAVLSDEAGNDYGVQFTLFRQALTAGPTGSGPWHSGTAYLGHLAVSDVSGGSHYHAQRFSRGHPELAGVTSGPGFRAWIEDWQLTSAATKGLAPSLTAGEAGKFAVDLRMQQTQALVLQGDGGWSRKSADSGSYYYSIPRMDVSGHLTLHGRTIDVRGLAWLDREWSTSVLAEELDGWDWFALQLDDGRSIMVYRLRRTDGQANPYDHAVVLAAGAHEVTRGGGIVTAGDPGVTLLEPAGVSLQPLRYWVDERGVPWPVAWSLDLAGEQLHVEALLDDQVMDAALIYWEGIVAVNSVTGERVGRGYMELTGYEAREADEGG